MLNNLKFDEFAWNPRASVTIARRSPQPPYPLHSHDFYEVVIVYSGKGCHFTNRFEHQVSVGDVFIIDRGYQHGYKAIEQLELVNIMYDQDTALTSAMDVESYPVFHALFHDEPLFRREHGFKHHLTLTSRQLAEAMALVDKMEEEAAQKSPGAGLVLSGYFLQLVGFLTKCYASALPDTYRPGIGVAQAINLMEKRYPEPIKISELAKELNMTPRTLTRHFKTATGSAPVDYYLKLKLRKAMTLLAKTDRTIAEIACETGFSDGNYLARQFKRLTGETPFHYRKKQNK